MGQRMGVVCCAGGLGVGAGGRWIGVWRPRLAEAIAELNRCAIALWREGVDGGVVGRWPMMCAHEES